MITLFYTKIHSEFFIFLGVALHYTIHHIKMIYFIQGLLFGLAYVMPIGIQNMYVINSAMQRNVKIICLTTIFVIIFDISLAISCYLGIGILLDKYQFLRDILS